MKNIQLLVLALSIGFISKAQITLTKAANAPIVGCIETDLYFDSAAVVPKITGLNKSWDFSNLIVIGGTSNYTYIASSSAPSVSAFPGANIATDDGSQNYNYYNSGTNTFDWVGNFDASINDILHFSDPMTQMIWPCTFGTMNNDVFAATETYSSTTTNYTGNFNINVSGTGTVTLPGGAKYNNCLQIMKTYTYIAGAPNSATYTGIDYEYWTTAFRSPIITISYGTSTQSTTTQKNFNAFANSAAGVGIKEVELESSAFVVFPNPTKDKLIVESQSNETPDEIELFDVSGKLILSEYKSNVLNVSNVNKGVYIVKVKSKDSVAQKQVIITE